MPNTRDHTAKKIDDLISLDPKRELDSTMNSPKHANSVTKILKNADLKAPLKEDIKLIDDF
jgi:hypothetical protein